MTIIHVVPDVVVEVAADWARQAGRHRHALRLIRLGPDVSPTDVEID